MAVSTEMIQKNPESITRLSKYTVYTISLLNLRSACPKKKITKIILPPKKYFLYLTGKTFSL